MAILYFSNNADNGEGSLSATIAAAQPGDVIRPGETIFERGSTIEIALASALTIDKNLTLDGGPFRVRLYGDGLSRCLSVATGVNVKITAFDFIGGGWNTQTETDVGKANGGGIYAASDSEITLSRCGIFGCRGTYGGAIAVATGATATLNDCVIAGCYARSMGAGLRSLGNVSVYGSTIMGNVEVSPGTSADILVDSSGAGRVTLANSIVGKYQGNVEIGDGCVVGVAASQIGFVAAPPVDLSAETWSANAWRNWDLRLLDDASPNPSLYRDSGDVDASSKYDLDGNFRGRETNGATTCSPGAYETIQADLFWIGRDATGAEVVSPSFLTSNGWATSRFATVSGDAAPQLGQTLFIDGNVNFVDVLSTTSAKTFGLTVGGGAVVAIDAASRVYFDKLQIALGASFTLTGITQPKTSARCGAWSRINSQFDAAAPCDFDVKSYFAYVIFYMAYAPNAATYGTLRVATEARDMIRLSGEYVCDVFSTTQNGTATNQTIKVGDDGATIRARQFRFAGDGAANYVESFFNRPVTLKLQGAASVSTPSTFRESWADDFLVDVTDATSATLTLCGQTVYGDAPTAAVELSGSAKIDERGLDVASLTLNNGVTLSVANAEVEAATLTLNADSTLVIENAEVSAKTLSAVAGSSLNIVGGRLDVAMLTLADDANVAFLNVDAVLSATQSVTVGAASFTGIGYFATPPGTDLTAATLAESIRVCDCGADVETFSASASSAITSSLAWKQSNENCAVLLEVYDNGWKVIGDNVDASASPFETTLNGSQRYRIFDGSKFLYDDAYFAVKSFYIYSISSTQKDVESLALYSKKTQIIRANMEGTRNENILLLAQIKNLLTGEFLPTTTVDNIKASVYKVNKSISSGDVWEAQDEWTEVVVEKEAILEEPVMIDGWTNDDTGANFIWTPDTRNKSLFKDGGRYVVQVTFNLINDNPIVISFNVNVK